jgi:hypothetical protein
MQAHIGPRNSAIVTLLVISPSSETPLGRGKKEEGMFVTYINIVPSRVFILIVFIYDLTMPLRVILSLSLSAL